MEIYRYPIRIIPPTIMRVPKIALWLFDPTSSHLCCFPAISAIPLALRTGRLENDPHCLIVDVRFAERVAHETALQ